MKLVNTWQVALCFIAALFIYPKLSAQLSLNLDYGNYSVGYQHDTLMG